MKLYTSVKRPMILTPQLSEQLTQLENFFGALPESEKRASSYHREHDKQLAQLESLREINRDMVFSNDLQWVLSQAQKQQNRYIVTFDIDEGTFIEEFPLALTKDDEGNEIKTFTLSAERFGELARTSKYAEGGQNAVFQEFKEKKHVSEPRKSEGFWNKVEDIFHRGWK